MSHSTPLGRLPSEASRATLAMMLAALRPWSWTGSRRARAKERTKARTKERAESQKERTRERRASLEMVKAGAASRGAAKVREKDGSKGRRGTKEASSKAEERKARSSTRACVPSAGSVATGRMSAPTRERVRSTRSSRAAAVVLFLPRRLRRPRQPPACHPQLLPVGFTAWRLQALRVTPFPQCPRSST